MNDCACRLETRIHNHRFIFIILFDALFDLGMITLRLGFCATRFDPVHDVVVFAVADGPFLSSFGPFLPDCLEGWSSRLACSETIYIILGWKIALCIFMGLTEIYKNVFSFYVLLYCQTYRM
jgi:hypothetical protein